MHEPVALGQPQELASITQEDGCRVGVLVHPEGIGFPDQCSPGAGSRIPGHQVEAGMRTIQGHKDGFLGVGGPGKERQNVLGVSRQGYRRTLPIVEGNHVQGCLWIGAARHRVAGIADRRRNRAVIGDWMILNLGFVQPQVDQPLSIGGPGVGRLRGTCRQLFVVHPIQGSVKDSLAAIPGQADDLTIAHADRIEVVVLHEGDPCAVRGEGRAGDAGTGLDERSQVPRVWVEQPECRPP